MKDPNERTIPLLDAVSDKLLAKEVATGMDDLVLELRHLRNTLPAETWQQFAQIDCLSHPIRELIH